MDGTSVAIGETIRAGFAAVRPSLSRCWAALAAGLGLSIAGALLNRGLPTSLLLALLGSTLVCGALYRQAFGRKPGWHGLRWGADEGRVLASHLLVLAIMSIVGVVLLLVVSSVTLGVARANDPKFDVTSLEALRGAVSGPGEIIVASVPLLCLVLLGWLAMRLALASAASVEQAQVRALSAFPLTRGLILPLAGSLLVLMTPLVLAAMVAGALSATAGFALVGVDILVSAAVYFYFVPAWVGALVHVYRRRRPLAETL
jgi:hypothetical protein